MTTDAKWLVIALVLPIALAAGVARGANDDAWWENSPYFNEDEWYDPSDWFDNNNYEFDREAYQSYRATARDARRYNFDFGFIEGSRDDDWFFDFYDDGFVAYRDQDEDDRYESYSRFFDFDDDRAYDALATYRDTDGDGRFDKVDFVYFNRVAKPNESDRPQEVGRTVAAAPTQAGRRHRVSGEITGSKEVLVRGAPHLVVILDSEDQGRLVVDLGPQRDLRDLNLSTGREITVAGPNARVGDKRVLVAQQLDVGDDSLAIRRDRSMIRGEIVRFSRAKIRQTQHLVATIRTEDGRRQRVDLGPERSLGELNLKAGDDIVVSGPTVQTEDYRILMAQLLQAGDRTVAIQRQQGDWPEAREGERRREQATKPPKTERL